MTLTRLNYEEFAKAAQHSGPDSFSQYVQQEKTVYVYALTRDRCSGCEIQKPLFEKLAASTQEKHGDRVQFHTIHVSEAKQFTERLQDFRRTLRFAAYPTYLILLKTDVGIVEIYRGIEPPMEEISRNIEIALELADR